MRQKTWIFRTNQLFLLLTVYEGEEGHQTKDTHHKVVDQTLVGQISHVHSNNVEHPIDHQHVGQ